MRGRCQTAMAQEMRDQGSGFRSPHSMPCGLNGTRRSDLRSVQCTPANQIKRLSGFAINALPNASCILSVGHLSANTWKEISNFFGLHFQSLATRSYLCNLHMRKVKHEQDVHGASDVCCCQLPALVVMAWW